MIDDFYQKGILLLESQIINQQSEPTNTFK